MNHFSSVRIAATNSDMSQLHFKIVFPNSAIASVNFISKTVVNIFYSYTLWKRSSGQTKILQMAEEQRARSGKIDEW